METLSSLILIVGMIIGVVVLVWIFGKILVMGARGGGTGSGYKNSDAQQKWNRHLDAWNKPQEDYLRSNDDEYKQWEYVRGQETTVDGEVVDDWNFENQLGSGR